MHTFVEDLTGLWKRIIITISCDCFNKEIDKNFLILSKTIDIAGFRKGKVPISFLKQKYSTVIHQKVIMDLMEKNFTYFISKNKIKFAGRPKYNVIESCTNISTVFIYSVIVEIYPTIKLQDLNKIIIEKPIVKITENDIDLLLDTVKKTCTVWENNNNKQISIGDRITFSITVQSDSTVIKQNIFFHNIDKIIMIIGQNRYNSTICDLEKNMMGCSIGDSFLICINCPNDYHITDMRGKSISFIVTIKKIEIPKFSKLNEDYFKYYNRLRIKEKIQCDLNNIIRKNIKNKLINNILCTNNMIIPETLIKNELCILKNAVKEIVYYIDHRFLGKSLYFLIFEEFNLVYQAKRRVKIALLLNEIIQHNKISIDYESISQFIKKLLDTSDYSKKIMQSLKHDITTKKYISFILLEEKVIDFLVDHVKIVEKDYTLSKLMNLDLVVSDY